MWEIIGYMDIREILTESELKLLFSGIRINPDGEINNYVRGHRGPHVDHPVQDEQEHHGVVL